MKKRMKFKRILLIISTFLILTLLGGCSGKSSEAGEPSNKVTGDANALSDGSYTVEITFEGGSGKAEILSPVTLLVEDKKVTARVCWNSPNYDYMLVDGEKYLPINTEGDSVFEIPVSGFDDKIDVIGDTVSMSKPHEVEYSLTFHSDTIKAVE